MNIYIVTVRILGSITSIVEIEVFSGEQEALAYYLESIEKYNLLGKEYEYSILTREIDYKLNDIEN